MEKYTYITLRQKAAVHFELRLLILIKLLSPMVLFSVYILSGKFMQIQVKSVAAVAAWSVIFLLFLFYYTIFRRFLP